jgi:quinol-cytochrome oxidoreductase complex cytochrome b subunit
MFIRKYKGFDIFANHIVNYPTPANLLYVWSFGSVAGVIFSSQLLTGIFLAMHYAADIELAFASVEHIMRDVNNGWFLRYLHANGASFFFLIVYFHIFRTLFFGYFVYSRRFIWLSGIVIFFLMMAIAFMGYVLPWGQMSFWGATVITNLFSAIPLIGTDVAYWLWGGFSVGNATLTRFFSLHYCLPFLLIGVILVHLGTLHNTGSYNILGIVRTGDKINFYPYFYVKDYFFFVCFALLVFKFFFFAPDALGHPDNYIEANALVTPAHIVPEWYFLPFYAILRAIPNKLGGVCAMGLAILILAVLPFYFRSLRSMYAQSRLIYMWWLLIFGFVMCILGNLGGLPIEDPYVILSQILTVVYFGFFIAFFMAESYLTQYLYIFNNYNSRLVKNYRRPIFKLN